MEQNQHKKATKIEQLDVADDVEPVKMAEMISRSSKDLNENSTNTKKRLQVLISRNHTLDSIVSAGYVEKNNSQQQINDNTDHNKTDQTNRTKKTFFESETTLDDFQIDVSKTKTKEISGDNILEKTRFEEIEEKLEEMFAGIEDEQLINIKSDDKASHRICNDSLQEYIKLTQNSTDVDNRELLISHCSKYNSSSHKASLPTKASQKSATLLLSSTENNRQLNLLLTDCKIPSIPKSMLYLKTMPQRRRLSIGINKELLQIPANMNDIINERNCSSNDIIGVDMASLSFDLKKNVPKNKINKNNPKKFSKSKNEIAYIKSNKSSKRKLVGRSEGPIKEMQLRQKINQSRMPRLLSSENDAEERHMQIRDTESKNKSPFILVKSNGSVAVVNTVTPDDSNEKLTRPKNRNSYVFERKTVKGCYSSTLGNRYDADTADSSWKCIFCQIGPHKKSLGDLFGPYIISSDCEEYQFTKDYYENIQKFRTNDAQHTTVFNKSVTLKNETSNFKSNSEHINSYTSGMSQVSLDCYEIWIHEECAIWAPNIYVVGSRLAGLDEATWNGTKYECVYCLKPGALLCCLQRNCKTTSHVPCAREFKWLLDESKFWSYCNKHAINILPTED